MEHVCVEDEASSVVQVPQPDGQERQVFLLLLMTYPVPQAEHSDLELVVLYVQVPVHPLEHTSHEFWGEPAFKA